MKQLKDLSSDIKKLQKKVESNLEIANRKTAESIWEDVVENAPVKSGEYISSIKIGATEKTNKSYKTFIGSDLIVGPAKSTGKSYNLGFLLETGTDPHAIPNAFNWGVIYGTDSEQYKRTLDPNWHPGTVAQPHYNPALLKNEEVHKKNIREAIIKAIKEV